MIIIAICVHKKKVLTHHLRVTIARPRSVGANSTIHGCTVENGAYIGHNVRLVNVNVGSQAIVGSGSVVAATTIPTKQLWGGIPGRSVIHVIERFVRSI